MREESLKSIYEKLALITDSPIELVKIGISEDKLENKTIRDIIHSFEIDKQLYNEAKVTTEGKTVVRCAVMLKLLAVMRRLQISDEDMTTIPDKVYSQSQNLFFEYFAPYMLLTENDKTSMEVTIYHRDEDGSPYGQRCKIN